MKRRRRDVGPVRLHVGQMQHPRRSALRADPVEREVRHVGGLGMRLGDARRQVHVSHLPAGGNAAAGIDGDHVLAPGIGAAVAARAQPGRVARLRPGRRVTVVPVDHRESAFAQQRAALRFDFDAEPRERLRRPAARASCPRALPCAPRRADSRRACARRRTAARDSTSRRASSRSARCNTTSGRDRRRRTARTHGRSARPARGQALEIGRRHGRRAVAGDEIAPQLVAHHEQHVADGGHRGDEGWSDRARLESGAVLCAAAGFRDNAAFTSAGQRAAAARPAPIAGMAELVDAADSKSAGSDTVGIRLPLPAPIKTMYYGNR